MFCQFFDWSKKKTYKRLIKEGEHELSWIDHEYFINCKMFIGQGIINDFPDKMNVLCPAVRNPLKNFLKILGTSWLWNKDSQGRVNMNYHELTTNVSLIVKCSSVVCWLIFSWMNLLLPCGQKSLKKSFWKSLEPMAQKWM